MPVACARQLRLVAPFDCQERFDASQIDSLLGKPCDFFAKEEVLLVVNAGAIAADAGNLNQAKAFPIAERLFVNAKFCSDFSDGQYHAVLTRRRLTTPH